MRLADFARQQNVALVFYPFAFSGICTGELCELRDDLGVFDDARRPGRRRLVRPVHAQRAWAEAEKYDFPLLSDFWPHGEVAQAYGVFNETTGSRSAARSWSTPRASCAGAWSTGRARRGRSSAYREARRGAVTDAARRRGL